MRRDFTESIRVVSRAGALLWPWLFRCLVGEPIPFHGPLNPKGLPLKIIGYIGQAAASLGFPE